MVSDAARDERPRIQWFEYRRRCRHVSELRIIAAAVFVTTTAEGTSVFTR
jgi:hypothetical protein